MFTKYVLVILLILGQASLHGDSTLARLKTSGRRIVDPRGRTVVLRGVNLGGWLVEELWMLPFVQEPPVHSKFKPINDSVSLWQTVDQRFGTAKMHELRTAFRKTWITERDFNRIRSAGFNCVRLPFLYDVLEEPDGFSWLDKAIEWAEKYRLYIVLDMHGTPGRQSKEHHTGQIGHNKLFSDPAMVKKTAKLWAKIAQRYKTRSAVAGYDLMNEPKGTPSNKKLYQVQNKIYQAIRKVDKRHIIFIEDGYKGIKRMPNPKKFGWKNVVLSSHGFTAEAKSERDHIKKLNQLTKKIKIKQAESKTPFYLGEFNVVPRGTAKTVQRFAQRMQDNKWSYSLWTYKVARQYNGNFMWGIYCAPHSCKKINPFTDNPKIFLKKIQQLRTEFFLQNKSLVTVFSGNYLF